MATATSTVAEIMRKLSISDTISVTNGFPRSHLLKACSEERTNPVAYLQATFDYPITLMSAMFDTGCVISGSRALEFFIPGTAMPNSAWDFYIPAYKESVIDMVNALNLCGVAWYTDADAISRDLVQNRKTVASTRVLQNLVSWITFLERENAIPILGRHLYMVIYAYSKWISKSSSYMVEITMDLNDNVHFTPYMQYESIDSPCLNLQKTSYNVLYGEIETPRGCEKIRLIIGTPFDGIRGCMAFIKTFYASHMQCFIGGWCAAHMYYVPTYKKKAILWKDAASKYDDDIQDEIQRYSERGFEFMDALRCGPNIRTLRDSDSLLLSYGELYRTFLPRQCYSLLDNWLLERNRNLETISWTEFDGRIVGLHSAMEKYNRVYKICSASTAESIPPSPPRLGNIIAVNTETSDSLKTRLFSSSMGKRMLKRCWEMSAVARSGTVSFNFEDATLWSWAL